MPQCLVCGNGTWRGPVSKLSMGSQASNAANRSSVGLIEAVN